MEQKFKITVEKKEVIRRNEMVEHEVTFDEYVILRMKQIRKSKGLTQAQLAERAGIHHSSLARLESKEERSNITLKTLAQLAYALDIRNWSEIFPPLKEVEDGCKNL
jgi:transcriptional regulator with XRE-family HTH domain